MIASDCIDERKPRLHVIATFSPYLTDDSNNASLRYTRGPHGNVLYQA